jgi:O-methyltransferase domain
VHWPLSKCSRSRMTVASVTRRSPRSYAQIIPSRSVMAPCFCPLPFFGAHSESSTNRFAPASPPKGVLHDWPDDDAARILRNTRAAIRPDGTLLLIENIVDSADRPAGLMDLLMLVVGGRERTEADFRSLLDSTRFSLTHIIPTEASRLIECHPA